MMQRKIDDGAVGQLRIKKIIINDEKMRGSELGRNVPVLHRC